MEKWWPAVDASGGDSDLILAAVDDCSPSAVDDRPGGVRVFFASSVQRDAALRCLAGRGFAASPIDVSDENWAERSQADLAPVTIGRFTIFPRPDAGTGSPFAIIIPPSTAFGTGHHATTRLCLDALQSLTLDGCRVLDVGTGSGVLAIAAARLGALAVVAVDHDPDALRTARETLALNGGDARVTFEEGDARAVAQARDGRRLDYDVVTANLTGALLVAAAPALLAATRPGGHLVLGGLLSPEAGQVAGAFVPAVPRRQAEEYGWTALVLRRP